MRWDGNYKVSIQQNTTQPLQVMFVLFWLGKILTHSDVSGVGETYNSGADNLSPKIETIRQ